MKKNIRVVLNETVSYLGEKNDIVSVRPGYAANFLVPNKLAKIVTQKELKYYEQRKILMLKQKKEKYNQALTLKNDLELTRYVIKRKMKSDGEIFGKISLLDIISVVKEVSKIDIEGLKIDLPLIKMKGDYSIQVEIYDGVSSFINLSILPK